MLNKHEVAYVAKGYLLPEGFAWQAFRERREAYDTPEWIVPLVSTSGVIAWGVPIELGCRKADGEAELVAVWGWGGAGVKEKTIDWVADVTGDVPAAELPEPWEASRNRRLRTATSGLLCKIVLALSARLR